MKEKKIKKSKALPEIGEEEKLFELPYGWEWARLNDLGDWGAGATPTRSNSDFYGGNIPWFKSGELTSDYIFNSEESVTELALSKSSLRYNDVGDVLVAMYGATIGKTAILGVKATTNQAVCACTTFDGFLNLYLLQLLKAYRPRLIGMGAGGAQPNISKDKLIATIVALPPFNEQKRIVSKIDELMALCDQLEQCCESQLAAHQTLVEALLATLTDSTDADELAQNWARLSTHFDTLFTTEASIDALKQTILQLAVMGKLVPQDPSDEPASALLERIAAEKAQLVKEKKIKKEKPLPAISEDEKLCNLPEGWVQCRLNDIIKISSGDGLTSKQMASDGSIPVFGGNGITGYHDQFNVSQPTIVIGRVGFYCGSVHITPSKAWVTDNAFITSFSHVNVHLYFLAWLLKATNLNEHDNATAQPVISGRKLYPIVVCLPPLAEQHRIVAKIDQLMTICDQLKSRLQTSQQTQLALAESLVEGALA
ncbi:restriction endonuclease subunit S [Aeromonas veronii]